tara:strand:+ start:295 stop:654 length:360 start_codon:yes stop_codon:yes gene_type:complete
MKKLIYIIVFLFSFNSFSQSINGVPFTEIDSPFIQIVGTVKLLSSKVTVMIDFGQSTKLFGNSKKQFSILDKENKKVVFNSMIDALNFMTKNGYKFEQAYVLTVGNSNTYHYLMSKNKT